MESIFLPFIYATRLGDVLFKAIESSERRTVLTEFPECTFLHPDSAHRTEIYIDEQELAMEGAAVVDW